MKSILNILFVLSSISATAFAADIEVTACIKNSKAMHISIKGESALNIFRAFAKRIGLTPAEMLNIISNGMNCEGKKFSNNGDVIEAECSYLMIGQKNIPYPEVDQGFQMKDQHIDCN